MSKKTRRSASRGSVGGEPWRETFETLRDRFEAGAASCPGLSCLLVHFGPGVRTPPVTPLVQGRIAQGDAAMCGLQDFRSRDLSALPSEFPLRHLYFANEPAALARFAKLATDATRCMEALPEAVRSRIPAVTSLVPFQPWVHAVFELAWEWRIDSPLKALKEIWDDKGIRWPYNTEALRACAEHGAEHLRVWAEKLPDFFCSELPDISAASADAIAILLSDASAAQTKAGTATATGKKSTVKGEARAKIIAALTLHHKYQNGGSLNTEPVAVRKLAKQADVASSSVTRFFNQQFGGEEKRDGHTKYKVVCRDPSRLAESLEILTGEFAPFRLYGRNPPGETGRADDC